jgi:hypothetical protein
MKQWLDLRPRWSICVVIAASCKHTHGSFEPARSWSPCLRTSKMPFPSHEGPVAAFFEDFGKCNHLLIQVAFITWGSCTSTYINQPQYVWVDLQLISKPLCGAVETIFPFPAVCAEALDHSIKLPRPAISWSVPVMIMALVGEHAAAAWKLVKRVPSSASRSMFGVLISPPKHPGSEKPRSSARMIRKFGFFVLLEVMIDRC